MKNFMKKNFLLESETAKTLYHDYAAKMPIVDYHCHVNPAEIAENRSYDTITQAWLGGDHYKWRLMRTAGVDEHYITGDSTDKEKFDMWAKALPKAIGNPLYHWTHLELKRYFDVEEPLSEETADEIFARCNAKLHTPQMSVRGIIEQSNVTVVCTTDDPIDTLEYHRQIKNDSTCKVRVYPAFRPDKAANIDKDGFGAYIKLLEEAAGVKIETFADLKAAMKNRLQFFAENGCKAADHGLDRIVATSATDAELNEILKKGLAGEAVTACEADAFKTALIVCLAEEYCRLGIVMQLHFGVDRNVNKAMFKQLGADTGFDVIASGNTSAGLAMLLNLLQEKGILPKTIIYPINSAFSEEIASIIGAFQGKGIGNKLQLGSAWWFNDTKTGMIKQLTDFANYSMLGNFVGMLTDSRSFLSYTRHEYFRRILCNLIGGWVENGEYPGDLESLGKMVQDICYNNTMRFFGFDF